MTKGLQYFEKNNIRIITSLRCGHRTLKNAKNNLGNDFFVNIPVNVEFFESHTLFPYDGETYFIIRDPMEHLISALTFTMGMWYGDSINSNGLFHQLPNEKKLNHCIDEIYFSKYNFHWVAYRYQTIYKEVIKLDLKKYKYDFIILKNLTDFLKNKFEIYEIDNKDEYNSPHYTKSQILDLLKNNKFENFDRLVEMCFVEKYYYLLLKEKKFSEKFCHDYIML